MNTLLLDAALGTQLAVNGEMLPDWKNSIWSAHALINKPDSILKIHLDNIEAGADVITTSNYYVTPVILAKDSEKHDYKELTLRALELAQEAIRLSGKDILIAGTFPPINVSFRPDLTGTKDELDHFYQSLGEIYKNKVDIILCESMSSIFEGKHASKNAKDFSNRVWLSWTNRGHQPDQLPSTETLSKAIDFSVETDIECVLINCSHADIASNSINELKRANRFGIYANSSTFKEVDLSIATKDVDAIHNLNSEEISAAEYARIALSWVKDGAYVIGGCCGTTFEHTREIRKLMGDL
tara:strand:- start:1685 stop:2578 length:894 start_codon:yes stop_codon:yes gene_type:complete